MKVKVKIFFTHMTNFSRPIDHEELPFPKNYAPQIISKLVNQLPDCWQQTAALALLPALSVACGTMTYGKTKKPLWAAYED